MLNLGSFYNERVIKWRPPVFEVYSFRKYGQPKLEKPKELKGMKQNFKVDFIPKKCSCSCYILKGDLWIQHRDYFSPAWKPPKDDFGKDTHYYMRKYFETNKKNKFGYADNWSSIVLRNEAWIKFVGFKEQFKYVHPLDIRQRMIEAMSEYYGWNWVDLNKCWERFFEGIINECRKEGGKDLIS